MKSRIYSLAIVLLMFTAGSAFAQSKSFEALKYQFKDSENVHSVSVSGFFCRMVLWMADDEELKEAIKELNHIRIITIPKTNFKDQNLTVNGFRKVLQRDQFESLATVRDQGEQLEIYLQQNGNKSKRYFVLVEDDTEVTAIELKGEIDIAKLNAMKKKEVVYQNL